MNKYIQSLKILLKKEDKKWTLEEIIELLNIQEKELPILKEALKQLEVSGEIYLNDCQEYLPFPKDSSLAIGELRFDYRKRPFILVGRNMIFIPENHLNGAIKGDIVLVKKNFFSHLGTNQSTVEKILKMQNGLIIFECQKRNGKKFIRPYNNPFSFRVSFSKKDRNAVKDGDRFSVQIDTINHNGNFHGKIICFIGHKGDPYLDIKTIAASHGIRIEFPDSVLEEAEQIPNQITEEEAKKELKKGRIDLREKMIFTIDGKHSCDLDDAVSIEKNEHGNYVLGVHIADVSYYVKEGSNLQKEAFLRGHSYYFLNLVFPMLPPKLSNGICSLNPGEDRFTKSCEIEISPDGNIIRYQIFNSIIRSRKKMAYEEVNQILDQQIPVPGYEEFIPTLHRMEEVSHILDQKKQKRGYLSFGDKDIYIHLDSLGIPTHTTLRTRGSSEKLIENFMLLANEVIGTYPKDLHLDQEELPYIYRIHDFPNQERIRSALNYLVQSGYPIEERQYQSSKDFQDLLNSISSLDAFPAISDILIRGLSKAKYSVENIGHFGLALPYYTHFTSPIRRYSDLQTHYNMNKYASRERFSLNPSEERKKMIEVCKHTTEVEKIADIADQEITAYKLAQFMEKKVGQTFPSMITYISKNHVIVKTNDFVTGTIPIEELGKMGYEITGGTTLIHSETNQKWRIGDLIEVTLHDVDLESRKIHFSLPSPKEKIYVKQV